jgi:hypothetical protein
VTPSPPAVARQPPTVQGHAPSVSAPEGDTVPLLQRDLEHPLAEPAETEGPPLRLDRSPRTPSKSSPGLHRQAVRQTAARSPKRSYTGLALGLFALVVVATAALLYARPKAKPPAVATAEKKELEAPEQRQRQRVTLALDPPDATVKIDQLPTMRDDLYLDQGSSHVLVAEAPGRIAQRLSFDVKAGLELLVRLGRTLALPLPDDADAASDELTARYPARPASRDEIARAFAKLERYGGCLALLGYGEGGARRANGGRPSSGAMSGCIRLVDEASSLQPETAKLHAAGMVYLQKARSNHGRPPLAKLLAEFRSAYLADRTRWQLEELSRQEADEGQTAAWHMRRVTLAAQAWVRGARGGSSKLASCHQALLDFAGRSPKDMARVVGAEAFMKAADELVALARAKAGRGSEAAALTGCRRLVEAFNALVAG